jgi:D-glycero-D-manno-heptose 1,7-bisphosphate phosphatase
VGDSLRDLQAGVAVGCVPHLVHRQGLKTLAKAACPPARACMTTWPRSRAG